MKIGIYGGSFNPIHKGHLSVAQIAIEELKLDKLIFVPAFRVASKSTIKYADPEDRVNMINLVKPEKSEVSMFELNRKGVSYTIDTVEYFKNQFPNDELFLIIGSDNVSKLNKWKSIDQIAEMTKIVVIRREKNFNRENAKRYNCLIIKNDIHEFSTEAFRRGQTQNVPEEVLKYISKNYLYATDLMVNMLDAKRHKHSVSVGQMAAQIAKTVNYDAKKAWFAGSMHDITKSWPKNDHREFLEYVGVDQTEIEDFELHSLTGYWWLKTQYLLEDEEVLNAVLRHTSLAPELTTLDKIIFAADKLADGRKFEGIQRIRDLILVDFEKGFKEIVKVTYSQLIESRDLSDEQKEVFKRWM